MTYVTLEPQLPLQKPVQRLAVLTGIRGIDAVVGAHDRGHLSFDGVLEGPEIQLVHGAVVEVGRNRLDGLSFFAYAGVSLECFGQHNSLRILHLYSSATYLRLLLIRNEIFPTKVSTKRLRNTQPSIQKTHASHKPATPSPESPQSSAKKNPPISIPSN